MPTPNIPSTLATPAAKSRVLLPTLFALVGVFGMAAVWVLVALIRDQQSAWMAILAAIDIAFLLRLGRAAPGAQRAMTTILATLATILIANWGIASIQIGMAMGFGVIESISRLGTDFAWTLADLANNGAELMWYAGALVVAYWFGK
jgi:hypothetical protein